MTKRGRRVDTVLAIFIKITIELVANRVNAASCLVSEQKLGPTLSLYIILGGSGVSKYLNQEAEEGGKEILHDHVGPNVSDFICEQTINRDRLCVR